ncbi:hypothetical protein MSG28_008553 [Choristoneura fumiferana]|uniref:Uncharacterized protein n=1 Tax=Choristoneura fumiferana TaxID=7141 RepID=A0ACC0J763_CHOFU|nr:hypothetical protein MSG28_008553 [Choristoneura fumiferana]
MLIIYTELTLVKHISLSLNVDFEKKVLSGFAVLSIDVLQDSNQVILDASNLTIESVELEDGTSLEYVLDEPVPNYGSKFTITLPKISSSGEK